MTLRRDLLDTMELPNVALEKLRAAQNSILGFFGRLKALPELSGARTGSCCSRVDFLPTCVNSSSKSEASELCLSVQLLTRGLQGRKEQNAAWSSHWQLV